MKTRIIPVFAVVCMISAMPVWAGETVEYKGARLVRQEERGMMVFETKSGEIKAQPSPGMKGYDLAGKEYSSGFAAAEKHEHAAQLLKIGNEFDLTLNKVNAKTSYISAVRLLKGEVMKFGEANQVTKSGGKQETGTRSQPGSERPAPPEQSATKESRTPREREREQGYLKAVIRTYEGGKLTFEADGQELTADVATGFKATDRAGRALKKDDRYRIFKDGNVATIITKQSGDKITVTSVRLTRGSLADR